MGKQTFTLKTYEMENGKVQAYAFPGGYPVYYICADNGILCPACVNKERSIIDAAGNHDKQWHVVAADVNYEDDNLKCDHCYARIESAYGDPSTADDSTDLLL